MGVKAVLVDPPPAAAAAAAAAAAVAAAAAAAAVAVAAAAVAAAGPTGGVWLCGVAETDGAGTVADGGWQSAAGSPPVSAAGGSVAVAESGNGAGSVCRWLKEAAQNGTKKSRK